ncbi:hypothetical protein [Corynebacterium diphtheriae]|uniref:hypothetical protein n=1 Tax=Corynebacterium diphtheriae TaxID=1717 RepID=UPI0018C92CA4|nr:hypothetical protein [Corynebacterium diphtheriae]
MRSLKYKHRDIRRNISEALFFIRESGWDGYSQERTKNAMIATICYSLFTALIEQFRRCALITSTLGTWGKQRRWARP